ncbi:MAG TPA: F0F1 ATP synthase subunit B [Isosphaeraceae bacterium]|jgi:F-type H+-transporting ATPase subunit b|nr:F0F1 ATP synthase subunit B [Isosphaeraceae bacterium]
MPPRRSIPALALGPVLAAALALAGPAPAPLRAADEPARTATAEAGAHVAAGGHAEKDPNLFEPEPSLAIWTLIVFGILLVVLGKFAWRPLLDAMHKREHDLEQTLLDAERARDDAARLLAEHQRKMEEAAAQMQAIIAQGRREAEVVREEIVRKAQEEAHAAQERARRDIENARDQALTELWNKTADMAVAVAGRVLERELGPDEHRRLVEVAAAELPAGPNGRGSSHA